MGKPTASAVSLNEYIVQESERGEVKHLSTLRKINQFRDFPSSGERTGKSLNLVYLFKLGVVGPQCETVSFRGRFWKGPQNRVIAPYSKRQAALVASRVTQGT